MACATPWVRTRKTSIDESTGADQVLDASARFLGHTRAPLVLLPIEDALGLQEQANLPWNREHPPQLVPTPWRRWRNPA